MKKKFINDRIKALRKSLKLNQTEFGERIGLKAGAIGKMEKEGGTVIEQNIKLICEKFHVRREWLVDGTGEMLQETEDTLFASFAQRHNFTEQEQKVARYLLRLTSEERAAILRHILAIADIMRQKAPPADATTAGEPATEPLPQEKPCWMTEDEWDTLQRNRTAKDGRSTEAG